MDRIINVKVGGNHLSKDNKNAGVKGEGNVTKLRITFDEGWDGYAKTVTFFDALGGNPVKRLLTVDLIEEITKDARTYITSIPQEPLAITGELTFVIDGFYGEFAKNADGEYEIVYADRSKRQRSIADKLVVKDAPIADNATEPTDPTPTEPEQWQAQIDKIVDDIQQVAIAKKETAEYAEDAKQSAGAAGTFAQDAVRSFNGAAISANQAKSSAEDAKASAEKAETAVAHYPVIVDGNWHVWDAKTNAFVDTGVCAEGHTPVRGTDYWTPGDKEYIVNEVKDMKKPDWNQNDEAAEDFIKNRTHYEHTKTEEISIEWQSDMPVDNLGEVKWVSYPGFSTTVPLVNGEVLTNLETGQDVVVEVNEEGTAVIGTDYYLFEDYGNGTYGYTSGYLYEASEQTGTYARYSREIKIIVPLDKKYLPPDFVGEVSRKEDKANKINSWDDFTGEMTGNEEYPTINMMMREDAELKKEIDACGNFELIESGTLKEDVIQIEPDFKGEKYKELYFYFNVPTINADSSNNAAKGRFSLNTYNSGAKKEIWNNQGYVVDNYKVQWWAVVTAKMYGNRCYSQVWFNKFYDNKIPYAIAPIAATFNGGVVPYEKLDNHYLEGFSVKFFSQTAGQRYLPAGTTYEFWGVRA